MQHIFILLFIVSFTFWCILLSHTPQLLTTLISFFLLFHEFLPTTMRLFPYPSYSLYSEIAILTIYVLPFICMSMSTHFNIPSSEKCFLLCLPFTTLFWNWFQLVHQKHTQKLISFDSNGFPCFFYFSNTLSSQVKYTFEYWATDNK
jgi:hypothetical protein